MGIDLSTTTLWAELATWKPYALDVIVRPEHWAIRGASRMGKALTFDDRYQDDRLEPSCLGAGVKAASRVVALLGKTEPRLSMWAEPPPPPAPHPEAVLDAIDAAGELIDALDPVGLDLLLAAAHGIQAGLTIGDEVSVEALKKLAAEPPRAPQRSSGPMSALLAASMDTLWIPGTLTHAWDGPLGTLASLPQLEADLLSLPAAWRSDTPPTSRELHAVWSVVQSFLEGIDAAKAGLSLRISG